MTEPRLLSLEVLRRVPVNGDTAPLLDHIRAAAAQREADLGAYMDKANELFDLRNRCGCGPEQSGPDIFQRYEADIRAAERRGIERGAEVCERIAAHSPRTTAAYIGRAIRALAPPEPAPGEPQRPSVIVGRELPMPTYEYQQPEAPIPGNSRVYGGDDRCPKCRGGAWLGCPACNGTGKASAAIRAPSASVGERLEASGTISDDEREALERKGAQRDKVGYVTEHDSLESFLDSVGHLPQRPPQLR